MTKIRRNHGSDQRGSSSNYAGRLAIFLVIFVVGIVLLGYSMKHKSVSTVPKGYVPVSNRTHQTPSVSDANDRNYLPSGHRSEIVHHTYYSLGYNESAEQADWVAYLLTDESLYVPNVKRSNWFSPDDLVGTHSATHADYKGSGYTRGHLAPAGDMAFNREAMTESFYMSNMSPQISGFNAGIWKELEENTRDWAIKHKELYIVTGPILHGNEKKIGRTTKVAVPQAFYKAILDVKSPELTGIAFVIPHRVCDEPLENFAMSIDDLEAHLGFDLYASIPQISNQIEESYDISHWRFDEKKYQDRVNSWNKQ